MLASLVGGAATSISLYLLDLVQHLRYHRAVKIVQADIDALLARYAAAQMLLDEALVACETGMTRTAVQKSWHAIQDVVKIDRELARLKLAI